MTAAIFSACGMYRYRLERIIAETGPTVAVTMVNPSTADHERNDQAVRKLIGFGQRLGWGRIIVGNKYAFKATDINELRSAKDPIGPDNDKHLEQIFRDADLHLVGWGTLSKLPPALRDRWKSIVRIADRVGCELHCIGTTADGHPKHPERTAYVVPMTKWAVPWIVNRAARADR